MEAAGILPDLVTYNTPLGKASEIVAVSRFPDPSKVIYCTVNGAARVQMENLQR